MPAVYFQTRGGGGADLCSNPAPRGRRLRSRCRTRRAASRRRTPRRRRGRSTATATVSGCGRAARRRVAAGLHTIDAIVSQQLVNNAPPAPIGPGTAHAREGSNIICLSRSGGHGLDRDAARPGPAIESSPGTASLHRYFRWRSSYASLGLRCRHIYVSLSSMCIVVKPASLLSPKLVQPAHRHVVTQQAARSVREPTLRNRHTPRASRVHRSTPLATQKRCAPLRRL